MNAEDAELLKRANSRLGSVLRGKYRLDRVLGVGGMASVYAVTHRNKKRFALKLLHPELSLRADIRTRFLREGYVANSVEHPGAVAILDDDVAEDGAAFLVMELLEGATVEDVWTGHSQRLPLEATLALVHQLLDVLATAHAQGVVHRDIKPANLFLTREGQLKVLDFGIARLRDVASSGATNTGLVMGTPAFMSPEQALGKTSQIDAQTDVWAAGAVLFTLVGGRFVHQGESSQEVLVRAATTPAMSFSSVMPMARAEVVQVVDCALAFNKAARWATAAAMRDALAAASVAVFGTAPSRELLIGLVGDRGRISSASLPRTVDSTGSGPAIPSAAAKETEYAEPVRSTVPIMRAGTGTEPGGGMAGGTGTALGTGTEVGSAPELTPPTVAAAPLGAMAGRVTTAKPVFRDQLPSLPSASTPRSKRMTAWIAAGAGGLLLGIVGVVAIVATGEKKPAPASPLSAITGAPAISISALSVQPSLSTSSAARPTSIPVDQLPQAQGTRPTASTLKPPPPSPTGGGLWWPGEAAVNHPVDCESCGSDPACLMTCQTGATPAPRPTATPTAPTPAAKPNCNPPYTFDDEGHKKWKVECL